MRSGSRETALAQLTPDHRVEIAMGDQYGGAAIVNLGREDVRGLGGAMLVERGAQ